MLKVYLKVALAVLLFCLIQAVGSAVLYMLMPDAFLNGGNTNVQMLAWALMLTGLCSCLVLVAMKMIRPCAAFSVRSFNWRMWLVAFLAAVTGIFAVDLLGEKANLPDLMGDEFLSMSHNVLGILALAVVGPIVEELVFREAVQGYMHRNGVDPWMAIMISSLCFGIIHFNPAQVPFAFCIGLILGMIYYKTGSVVLTSLVHVFNNSMAVLEMRLLGEDIKTFSYEQALGGPLASYIYIAISAAVSVCLLRYYWKNASTKNGEHFSKEFSAVLWVGSDGALCSNGAGKE